MRVLPLCAIVLAAMPGVTGCVAELDAHALPGGMKHDAPDSPQSQFISGPIQENREKVRRANPLTYVSRGAPPFLILHGEGGLLVPAHQSQLLFEALGPAGVPTSFHSIAGAGHGGGPFQTAPVRALVLAFLDERLRGGPDGREGARP